MSSLLIERQRQVIRATELFFSLRFDEDSGRPPSQTIADGQKMLILTVAVTAWDVKIGKTLFGLREVRRCRNHVMLDRQDA